MPLLAGLCLLATACFSYPPDHVASGQIGGRVLLAPGVGLEGARVVVTQVNLYDGVGAVRQRVGEATTDASGYFPAVATGLANGLLLLETQGGTYTDPVNGARIELDPSVHLRALHWLGIYQDRSTTAWVTPVHALIEARFRNQVTALHDTFKAVDAAYAESNRQFGGLDWETIIPADLTQAATSPTDAIRASFILGGLSVLSDDIRQASNASPQAVGLTTLLGAMEQDMANGPLDGDDNNVAGTGLQVGECEPVNLSCVPPEPGCSLGACRTLCDVYANTYRTLLADAVSKFIGPKAAPTLWNKTGLGAEDARPLIDGIAKNDDKAIFGDACIDAAHRAPPTIAWEIAPDDTHFQSGFITVRVRAIDTVGNRVPTVKFDGYDDTDGDPNNDVATASINTLAATHGLDGALHVTAIATGAAGAKATSTRTFQIDNTVPSVSLDSTGFLVDNNIWWTNARGPMLQGMATDMHGPITVRVSIGGNVVATQPVDGPQWSLKLPDGALPTEGAEVTVSATDAASNTFSRIQKMRLDDAAPNVTVVKSEVFDEGVGDISFEDSPTPVARHTTSGTPADLALSSTGTCPTIHKYAHLLFAPKPDGSHAVLGSVGNLNPLQVNVLMSDDGIGLKPGSAQYQVVLRVPGTPDVVVQTWTSIPDTGRLFNIPLYRDTIPQLGTKNGEYHVQLQATDKFGKSAIGEACWNHVILAPPLRDSSSQPQGEPARGFPQALWTTSLNPQTGEFGDFTAKFLNPNPATEAAVWRDRVKNYLAMPVFVTVRIPRGLSATVHREFKVVQSFSNSRNTHIKCGTDSNTTINCNPPQHVTKTSGPTVDTTHSDLRFNAHLFLAAGNNLGNAPTCPPPFTSCVVSANDADQSYVFEIPPRSDGQALAEYAIVTNLLPSLPAGAGTNVLMEPRLPGEQGVLTCSDFPFGNFTLTGKPPGSVAGASGLCTDTVQGDPDFGEHGLYCSVLGDLVEYRALTNVRYQLNSVVNTSYSFSALPELPGNGEASGRLTPASNLLTSEVDPLP